MSLVNWSLSLLRVLRSPFCVLGSEVRDQKSEDRGHRSSVIAHRSSLIELGILNTLPAKDYLVSIRKVFLSGNEKFFLLARKSSNYEEAYLNTLTNNCAD